MPWFVITNDSGIFCMMGDDDIDDDNVLSFFVAIVVYVVVRYSILLRRSVGICVRGGLVRHVVAPYG